jgi:cardiolipin synthase
MVTNKNQHGSAKLRRFGMQSEIMTFNKWIQWLAPVLFYLFIYFSGIALSIHALIRVRTSQGAIAWILSLLLIPYLAIPAYLIFGWRRLRGYKRALRRSRKDVQELLAPKKLQNIVGESQTAFSLTQLRLAQLPPTRDNETEIFFEGNASFEAKLESMRQAKDYILLQAYIIRNDESGEALFRLLAERARAGIRVYVLIDDIGSYWLKRSRLKELRAAGVNIQSFRSSRFRSNRFRINFRNHRKMLIIDGRTVILGGSNIGNEYRSLCQRVGFWRDTDVQIRGPAVQCCQIAFVEDWLWVADQVPTLNWIPEFRDGNEEILIAATGPADDWEACGLLFTDLINGAAERLWIATPYFVPDTAVMTALKLAVLRGVDVRILTPEKGDHQLVTYAGHNYMAQLAEIGVRTYAYQRGFMHQKVTLIDKKFVAIGSANMDNRSFRLNFELTCLSSSRPTIDQIETQLIQDFADSRELDRAHWRSQSVATRVLWGVARLFAPVL